MTPAMEKTAAEDAELNQLEQEIGAFLATGDSTAIERRLTSLCKELLPRLQKTQGSRSEGLRSSDREQALYAQQVFFRLAVVLGRLLDRWTRPGASDDLRRLANDVIELHDDVIELHTRLRRMR